jgi:hypothetical protein
MSICLITNPSAGSAEQFTTLRQALAERPEIRLREPEKPQQARAFAAEVVQAGYDLTRARLVEAQVPFPYQPLRAARQLFEDAPAVFSKADAVV